MTNKFIPGQMYKDRNGREYMFVGYAPNATTLTQAVFTYDKNIVARDLQGKSFNSEYDIIMTKDVWVNVFRDTASQTGVCSGTKTYATEEDAKHATNGIKSYLLSQKITVEV